MIFSVRIEEVGVRESDSELLQFMPLCLRSRGDKVIL